SLLLARGSGRPAEVDRRRQSGVHPLGGARRHQQAGRQGSPAAGFLSAVGEGLGVGHRAFGARGDARQSGRAGSGLAGSGVSEQRQPRESDGRLSTGARTGSESARSEQGREGIERRRRRQGRLRMKQRQVGSIVILYPKGYLTGGDETDELERTIKD